LFHECYLFRAQLSGKNPWGQLAPNFSDLFASKSISVKSIKCLSPVKKKLVALATPRSQQQALLFDQ